MQTIWTWSADWTIPYLRTLDSQISRRAEIDASAWFYTPDELETKRSWLPFPFPFWSNSGENLLVGSQLPHLYISLALQQWINPCSLFAQKIRPGQISAIGHWDGQRGFGTIVSRQNDLSFAYKLVCTTRGESLLWEVNWVILRHNREIYGRWLKIHNITR